MQISSELTLCEDYLNLLKQIHTETVQWNFDNQCMLEDLLELGYCYLPKQNDFSQNPILTTIGLRALNLI